MFVFEDIYNTLIGNDTLEFTIPWVNSLCEDGTPYMLAYQDVLEARERLCIRLGSDPGLPAEDTDIEIIINAMLDMQREVAWWMFHYGTQYRKHIYKK